MTRLLFWEDAYIREFNAQVVKVDGGAVELGGTAFFFSSGGQPSDSGRIDGLKVIDVRRGPSGEALHILEETPNFKAGDMVRGVIDWERRYKIMRLHSACHVMSGVLLKSFGVRRHTGIQIYDDRARMDFDMDKLDGETAAAIEKEVNRVIESHLDIVAKILTWEEVNQDPNLKTVSEDRYEKFDVPRLLEIVGFDRQLDGGTHVANTSEIGKIRIVKRENKGRNNKRIILVVE